MRVLDAAFQYVISASKMYGIDESHSIGHSLQVFNYANMIYQSELVNTPSLYSQLNIIHCASILHDMCDKKYVDEHRAMHDMKLYMKPFLPSSQIDVIQAIIMSMSYSTVQKYGFPQLGEFQTAYHIVREADLLDAYSLERSVVYKMMVEKRNYTDALVHARLLMDSRVLRYIEDGLFITERGKHIAAMKNALLLKQLHPTNT